MPRPREHLNRTLTNTAIEAMLPGDELRDSEVPGLMVRCGPAGRSFLLYYTARGRRRRPKIGAYGAVSIATARAVARRMLADVAMGNDPSALRQAERQAPTLANLWVRVAAEHYVGETGWPREARGIWARCIEPRLGAVRVGDIDYSAVKRMHDALSATPTQANHALAVLSKMLGLAERWGLRPMGSNPCQHVRRFPVRARKRFATAAEMSALGDKLRVYATDDPTGAAFVYLMAFSGARPSEIERARWDQLVRRDDGSGVLRIADGKTGHRDVFLPPQAMAVVDALPRRDGTIVGRKAPRALWARLRTEIGAEDLWLRDLRRTFATVGLSGGVASGVVGELLGHASAQTTKIYAKLMEDPAARAASDIATRVAGLLGETR